jgi:hypothetical protein
LAYSKIAGVSAVGMSASLSCTRLLRSFQSDQPDEGIKAFSFGLLAICFQGAHNQVTEG